jgi:hypothetical protein
MREEDVVAAARVIRQRLPNVVGDASSELAGVLDALLRRADHGERVVDDIFETLASDDRTRRELQVLLRLDDDRLRQGYPGGPPGQSWPTSTLVYGCTRCDYRYPVFEIGEPVPDCPRGHGSLTPVRSVTD